MVDRPTIEQWNALYGADMGDWGDGLDNGYNGGSVWFDPLAILWDQVGGTDAYDFWACQCAQQWAPQLINLQQIDESSRAPLYQCFSAFNIANQGVCNIASGWLYSIFWSQRRGLPENPTCAGPEGPPEG